MWLWSTRVLALFHAYSGDERAAAAEAREAGVWIPAMRYSMHGSGTPRAWPAEAPRRSRSSDAPKSCLVFTTRRPRSRISRTHTRKTAGMTMPLGSSRSSRAKRRIGISKRATGRSAYLAVGDQDSARAALETVIEKIAREEPDGGFLALRLIRFNVYSDPVLEQHPFRELRAQLRGK